MTIKEIKSVFKVFNPEDEGKYIIYDKFDYRGYFTKEKTKFFYHGFPEDEPVKFSSVDELKTLIESFLERCDNEWINPDGFNPMNNVGHNAELAFFYLANKFGWTRNGVFSSRFSVGSNTFGVNGFNIEPEYDYKQQVCKFTIWYNNGWYSTSPGFSDYLSAMTWLKNTLGPIMLSIGMDFIITPINNGMLEHEMEDSIMNNLVISDGKMTLLKASLKDTLIATLEKQLEMLKK